MNVIPVQEPAGAAPDGAEVISSAQPSPPPDGGEGVVAGGPWEPMSTQTVRGTVSRREREASVRRVPQILKLHGPLLAVLGAYVLVRSRYWGCPPVWDGHWSYAALLAANEAPFDLLNYTTDGHVSQGFFLLNVLPDLLAPRDFRFFNVWLTGFGVVSVTAFHGLLTFYTAGRMGRVELALASALFAFHPPVLASMIHFSLDMGVLTFCLCCWLMLLHERVVLATVFALLLGFTKETAFLLLPLLFLFCTLTQERGARLLWLRRHLPVLLVPGAAVLLFLSYKTAVRAQPAFWINYQDAGPLDTLLNLFTPDAKFMNYLVMMFVMNFNWVLSLAGAALMASLALKRDSEETLSQVRVAVLLYLLLLGSAAVVLLVRPWSNVRYVMVVFPVLFLCLFHWALVAGVPRAIRIVAALLLLALFAVANVRTLDPVSKAYFGTFDFGTHKMLAVARQTREPGAWGRDQLVYNLEFLKVPQLVQAIVQDVRPAPDTFILNHPALNHAHPFNRWGVHTRLETTTWRMTFQTNGTFLPRYATAGEIAELPTLPDEVYFIVFPNCDNGREIERLARLYPRRTEKVYERDGYRISVLHFQKSPTPAPFLEL